MICSVTVYTQILSSQGEKKEEAVGQTLTRGQITALAAVSISDIDLLVQHIDRDEDDRARFYELVLVLICVSLALQIVCGLLTITVSHLRAYYRKFREDRAVSDMCKMWCGCLLHKHNNDPCDGCRGVFTCRVHPEYEYDVLKRYDDWRTQAVAVEMDAALSFDDLDAIEFQIRQAREKVEEIQKKLKGADPADKTLKTRLETEMNQAKDKLLEAESNKDNLLRNKEDLVAWRKTRKEG